MNINLHCPYRPEPELPDSTEIYHEGDLYIEGEEPKEAEQ
jgi:hypothetical protein